MNTNYNTRDQNGGKFQPQFGKAWFKAEQRKQQEIERRNAEIVTENATWAAEHGFSEAELQDFFA